MARKKLCSLGLLFIGWLSSTQALSKPPDRVTRRPLNWPPGAKPRLFFCLLDLACRELAIHFVGVKQYLVARFDFLEHGRVSRAPHHGH